MSDLTYKKKDVLGLDIGTKLIKYVQLKNQGKLTKLVGYGTINVPENIIVEGVISEPEKLAEIIGKAIVDPPWGKINAKAIVASLPESKLFTRIIELPSLSKKDIEEAVSYEVDQSIPIPSTDLYTDWEIIEEGKEKSLIFLAAAPRSIVNTYVQLFSEMKLDPLALEVSLAAIARALIPKEKKNDPVIILDIGGSTTNIAIYDKGLQITGSHPVGAVTIKEELKAALNVTQKEADAFVKKGITENSKASKIIMENFDKINTEIERMVKYYKDRHKEKSIKEILLCGGLGAMNGLTSYMEGKTNILTRVGNPWTNISIYPLKPVPKSEAPQYSAAIGLCLRGFDE
ncbi:MAG: type IV pilus assembly protein PilM [Patescibacteria group bacterium]|nr:type IV pilus assembly protein PilM [Patescibacteria group bacterium]